MDDYFALLNLDLECDDPARIRSAVARKRTQCAQGAMVGLDKMACAQLLARLPEIERALLDPATRRQARENARRLRSAAREERLEAFHEDLAMLVAGGRDSITVPERDHLLETYGRPEGPTAAELSALIGVPVVRPKASTAAPLPAYEAKEIARNLAVLGKADLYDFLGLPPAAAAAQIKARREEFTRTWNRKAPATAEKSAAQALLGKVGTLLLDQAKRDRYAATLRAARFAPLQQALKLALLDGHLSASEHANLLARAKRLGISSEEAEQAILAAAAAVGAHVEAPAAAATPAPAADEFKSTAAKPAPADAGKLVATFGPSSNLAGRTVTWKDSRLIFDGQRPISAADVLSHDRRGHIMWAHEDLREWVHKLAATHDGAFIDATWRARRARRSGIGLDLRGIAFPDASYGWAVGGAGTILTTKDGGAIWRAQRSGVTEWLRAVTFIDATHGWAVGGRGTILATTDAGANWKAQSSGSGAGLWGIAFSDGVHGWAVGDAGVILATTDAGATWSRQISVGSAALRAVAFADATHGWAVGDTGAILATTNAGATWMAQRSGPGVHLTSVAFPDAIHGWAVGMSGTILTTTDGGVTWRAQSSGSGAGLCGVAFCDATHGWAVGMSGTILVTKDGGAIWKAQVSGRNEYLRAVAFIDSMNGWAVGDGGIMLATRSAASRPAPVTTPEAHEAGANATRPPQGGPSGETGDPVARGLRHPVVGILPVGSVPLLADYEVAALDIAESIDNLVMVPTAQLTDWLVQVADVESPIRLEEATRRVARAAGIGRVGHLIDAAFKAAAVRAARDQLLVVCGDFLWSPHRPEMEVRNRVVLPSATRKIGLIADEEVEWAACAVLSSLGRVDEDDVPRQVMGVLGFERTSRDAEDRVRAALARGVEVGAFVRLGAAVAFVGADGTPLPAGSTPARAMPRPSVEGVTSYQVAQPVVELRGSQFHELSRDYLADALQAVIAVESPIHVSQASRRLANAAGLERVGHRIQSAVSAACLALEREGLIERRGDFLWGPDAELEVRDRSSAPASVRNIKMIAPEEILQAARLAGAADLDDEDEAVIAVARLLGFRRTGSDLHAAIGAILALDLGMGDE